MNFLINLHRFETQIITDSRYLNRNERVCETLLSLYTDSGYINNENIQDFIIFIQKRLRMLLITLLN